MNSNYEVHSLADGYACVVRRQFSSDRSYDQRREISIDDLIDIQRAARTPATLIWELLNTRLNYKLLYKLFDIPEEFRVVYDSMLCKIMLRTSFGAFPSKPIDFNTVVWSHMQTREELGVVYIEDLPENRKALEQYFDIIFPMATASIITCTDCKGTKKYVGFSIIEDCRLCNGTGLISGLEIDTVGLLPGVDDIIGGGN